MARTNMARPHDTRRHIALLALVALVLTALAPTGCAKGVASSDGSAAQPLPTTAAPAFPVTVTDDASRTVTVDSEPKRIVSLAPANTEMLAALGLEGRLVGVTTYDDYPPSVKDLPKMGDFVTPNLEAIGAATPDLVVATTGVQADVLKKLQDLGAVVIAIDPQTLAGLYADIGMLGQATGRSAEAEKLVASMRSDIAGISSAVSGEAAVSTFVEIGQNPLFTVGGNTLIDQMLVAAGGKNVVTAPGYVAYSLEQLVVDDPEVYFATMGTMSDPSDMAKRAGYNKLSAVENGRVYTLEDNLVTRPGPRIVEGIRAMAAALHPNAVGK
jgi:iron complex transport system substrate-binding protein